MNNHIIYKLMQVVGITLFVIGGILCLIDIRHFSDKNMLLMTGLGFMVASGFLYLIGIAFRLAQEQKKEN